MRNRSGVTVASQRNILSRFRSHRDRVECRGATVVFLAEAEGRSKRAWKDGARRGEARS